MLRKSLSINRNENSKVRAFNPVESGTCYSPVLCLKQLNYLSCQKSLVTTDSNWWDKYQNN